MKAEELVRTLTQSDFVKSEIPMQMEMGLPYLRRTAKGICIGFRPHIENYVGGITTVYPQQYEIEWIYPFQHLIRYRNLIVDTDSERNMPVGTVDDETMLSMGLYYIKELYGELDRVLEHLEESGDISDVTLSRYQEKYRRAAQALGLEKLYCAER